MLASSAFVLAALTMTGVYMKGQNVESRDDGYTLDFTALPNNADDKLQEITENNDEHLLKEDENIPGLTANNTAGNEIAGTPVTEDDLDYMPQEVGSGNVEIPGLTDQETLLEAAQRLDADVVQGGWQYLDGDGKFGAAQRFAEHIYEKRTAYDCLDLPGTPWAKLYRRSLFEEIRFPAGYTCFEDAVIHFLIFPAAEKIASISQVVYAWRRNANGITFTSQGTKKAVQAYWIVEELLEQHRRIKQPCDELFYRNLTLQLSNYCYVCVAGLTEEEKQGVFACCCLLYQKNAGDYEAKHAPFAVRTAHRALMTSEYGLWKLQGKWFPLIA